MNLEQIFVLALLGVVFVGFIKEIYPPEVIAIAASAVLLATGIVDTDRFLSVFSSPAPITIAMMFVLSAALERTGVLTLLGRFLRRQARGSYLRTMVVVMAGTTVASAFMNSTPVVILMTPIVISLAASLGIASSRLLIPLSYAAIFAGTLTLVGTSTNILVSAAAQDLGEPAVGMFEMTAPGLILAGVGMIYMLFAGRFLLPDRDSLSEIIGQAGKRRFMARLLIPAGSRYVGSRLKNLPINTEESEILDVLRGDKSLRTRLDDLTLDAGDRVVTRTDTGEILGLKEDGEIAFRDLSDRGFEPVHAEQTLLLEATVAPDSPLVGQILRDLHLRRNYGVYVLAVQRDDENISARVDDTRLQFADKLLLEGPPEGMKRLRDSGGIVDLAEPREHPVRHRKAPVAIATMVGVMALAAMGVLHIAGLAVIGAAVVMLTRCVDPKEAFAAVDLRILFLIFGMLGLSLGLEETGAAAFLVENAVRAAGTAGPLAVLAAVYVLTSLLSAIVSNNAVAVMIAPIALSLAVELGHDPRPFIIGVMFAASASFATPIGYQTNTFVYSAGGYRFRDFVVVGLSLNILFAVVAVLIIPWFFPF